MFGEAILQISLPVCFPIEHIHSHDLDRILVVFQECERNTAILVMAVSEGNGRVGNIKTCLAEYLLTFFVYGGNKYEDFTVHEVRDFLADLCLGQGFFWVEEVASLENLRRFWTCWGVISILAFNSMSSDTARVLTPKTL